MAPSRPSTEYFTQLGREIWQVCEEKGFHEPIDPKIMGQAVRLLLIISEVSEAFDDLRKGDVEHHNEEIADVQIRLLHYAANEGINLDAEVARKMAINANRPYKHGKQF